MSAQRSSEREQRCDELLARYREIGPAAVLAAALAAARRQEEKPAVDKRPPVLEEAA